MAFHFQNTVQDWPRAVAKLPAQSCVKAVDRGDILRDTKAINPGIFTILRHWDDSLQHYDGNTDWAVLVERARHWFSTHIDGTFKDQYANVTDAVSWHNEIWANSQTSAEQYERIRASEAAVWVWNTEYRFTFANDIKLIIGEAAIGNDMPREIAALAIASDNIVGYHPYTAWGWDTPKVRWGEDEFDDEPWDTLDWYNLSGRWDVMEHNWGLKPVWAFTEAGPFGNVMNGWKHSDVCGGDRALYVRAVKDWIRDVQLTPAYKEGRIVGFNLFTTGGSDKWKYYESAQPELNELADMIAAEWKPGTAPPPPPPPPDDFKVNAWKVTSGQQISGQGGLQLNPGAGIQQKVTQDNRDNGLDLQIVTTETKVDGKTVQAAESLSGKVGRRVYVWQSGKPVYWFGDPGGAANGETSWSIASPLPIPLVVTSPFNVQRDYGRHEGIDLRAVDGTGKVILVLAVADGTVVWASDKRRSDGKPSDYGWHVIVDHGNNYLTWYCHLSVLYTAAGRIVMQGDELGLSGSTGNSTGVHLHFNIQDLINGLDGYVVSKVVDPAPYLRLP